MTKALLSVAMAAVISLSATAVSSMVVGAVSSNLATPKITKAESVDGGVKISWGKSNGAEKYRVYYKGSKGWTRMVDTTSTSYIDKDVSSGKNYTYTVRCINSSATKFTSGYDSKGKSVKYISAPKISKTENVNGGVKISWGKSNGAEKYRVYYKGSKGWTRMVDTTSTSYIDKDVSSGKNYTYTVRCINSSATKFTSGYDSKGTKATFIAVPKITKAESVDGGVKISWNKSNGAEKYRVYYKGSKGWTRMVDTTSTSYIDKDVSSGKNYTYTVRCINSSATKFTSGYDSKGKSLKYISAPKITKAESVDGGVKISWNKSNGAEKYRVYYKGSKGWTRMVDTTSTSYIDKDVSSGKNYTYTVRCINSSATKFTSGYDSKGKSVKYISSPAEHTHSWQNITKETQVKVVDKEAYTYEEPIYEKHDRTICKVCGADITDNCSEHNKQHALNGEPVSYHNVWVNVQVGTKTVTVPEKSHYETKTEVVGRKCTVCGKVEMFSEEHTHTWQNITKETQVKVVDKKAYTYEEPIYEKHDRTICNRCGADITDNLEHIFECNSNYHNEWRDIQVGTKTVTVPEKSHYETKTEVVGRKCTVCGKVEMFSEEHTHTWQNITNETKVKVVDEKATVKQMQTVVCSEPTCQNDLSGYTSEQISEHMKQHALNGENAGWHTSTKTVEVPEKFHYETKTEVVGRKCTECGEIEYY